MKYGAAGSAGAAGKTFFNIFPARFGRYLILEVGVEFVIYNDLFHDQFLF